MASCSLMASQTLILQNPNFSSPKLTLKPQKFTISASSTTVFNDKSTNLSTNPSTLNPLITRSTRTITTLGAITLAVTKLMFNKFTNSGLRELAQSLVYSSGPMFFAAVKNNPPTTESLNTPLTVVAAGMSKWLDIYSGVLMIRVLLSWFPNIPWERQPLAAIRDLCDPYLNLFRNIIPPVFNTLDVSPLLAFAVLGTLGSILDSSRGAS